MTATNVDQVFTKVVASSVHASQAGIEFLKVDEENKVLLFKKGSVIGQILVKEWNEGIILVLIHIPIVLKPRRIDGNTLLKILQMNSDIIYGAIGYNRRENIIDFSHTLLGNTLDTEEIFMALTIMSQYADDIDEELCQLTGGDRGIDFLKKQLS